MQSDVSTLVAQIRDLDKRNAELEEQNKNLASMVGLLFMWLFVSSQVFTLGGFWFWVMANLVVPNYTVVLIFQLETKEAGSDVLQKRLNDLVNTPSLNVLTFSGCSHLLCCCNCRSKTPYRP